jgi:hypothetical protein
MTAPKPIPIGIKAAVDRSTELPIEHKYCGSELNAHQHCHSRGSSLSALTYKGNQQSCEIHSTGKESSRLL